MREVLCGVGGNLFLAAIASQFWRGHAHERTGGFVFLFEWSWEDVAKECEQWLAPKKIYSVYVSPPSEHVQGDAWWTRYQPVSYKLISRSGDEAAFRSMVARCKAVGVGVIVDSVTNHCATMSGVGIAGSMYGDRRYPMYTPEDFHHSKGDVHLNCQVDNYNDLHNIQYCDLLGLPDLCTSCPKTQRVLAAYLNKLASLGCAGLRIDAAKHQNADELRSLLDKVDRKLYRFLEVMEGVGEAVTPQMYLSGIGDVTEFAYAWKVAPSLNGQADLRDLLFINNSLTRIPSDSAVVFIDNHDTQRGGAPLTYKNAQSYILANVFMLAYPYGYPMVMSSYYFDSFNQGPPLQPVYLSGNATRCGDGSTWVCEHRVTAIANMFAWRLTADQAGAIYVNDVQGWEETLAFCRGGAACVALNRGLAPWTAQLRFSLPPGNYCDVIQSDGAECPCISVEKGGFANVVVPTLGAIAIHLGAPCSKSSQTATPTAAPTVAPPAFPTPAPPESMQCKIYRDELRLAKDRVRKECGLAEASSAVELATLPRQSVSTALLIGCSGIAVGALTTLALTRIAGWPRSQGSEPLLLGDH